MSEQSDIDVVVELETQDLFDLIGIKLDLEEQLSQQVDIVSYREKMKEFLKRRIDKEAVYVWSGSRTGDIDPDKIIILKFQ